MGSKEMEINFHEIWLPAHKAWRASISKFSAQKNHKALILNWTVCVCSLWCLLLGICTYDFAQLVLNYDFSSLIGVCFFTCSTNRKWNGVAKINRIEKKGFLGAIGGVVPTKNVAVCRLIEWLIECLIDSQIDRLNAWLPSRRASLSATPCHAHVLRPQAKAFHFVLRPTLFT